MELTVEERLKALATGKIIMGANGCKYKLEKSVLWYCLINSKIWYKERSISEGLFDRHEIFTLYEI